MQRKILIVHCRQIIWLAYTQATIDIEFFNRQFPVFSACSQWQWLLHCTIAYVDITYNLLIQVEKMIIFDVSVKKNFIFMFI